MFSTGLSYGSIYISLVPGYDLTFVGENVIIKGVDYVTDSEMRAGVSQATLTTHLN